MKKIAVLIALLLIADIGYSQLSFASRTEYSQGANSNDKQLFLIDFWATWCGPCITVGKYLGGVQEQFPDDLYIVSLAYESESQIQSFLKRNPTKLAVSIDDNKKNFEAFNIRSLPDGILFNAKGEIIWRGNPANLKPPMIEKFLRQNKSRIAIDDFISYTNPSPTSSTEEEFYIPHKYNVVDYSISSTDESHNESTVVIRKNEDYTVITGTLEHVIGFLMGANENQMNSKITSNKAFTVILQDGQQKATKEQIAQELLSQEGLQLSKTTKQGLIYTVALGEGDQKFWTQDSMDWGTEERPAFIVGNSDFKADNISFDTLVFKLSELTQTPIIIDNNSNIPEGVYDWEVHYEFVDIMKMNLDRLGIQFSKETASYPVYTITKR